MAEANDSDPFVSYSDQEEEKAPDVIASIYVSMSQIIDALNTDNLLLNKQVNKIRGELEFVCNTLATLKMDTQEISSVCGIRSSDLHELKKKIAAIGDLQKHVVETRNMLIQTLDTNIKSIKKELGELRNTKDNIRPYIKSLVEEEIKQYMSVMPSLEKRLDAFEREQRSVLANHIRKSTIQTRNTALQAETDGIAQMIKDNLNKTQDTTIADISQLKEEQRIFMEKIEGYLLQLKNKIGVL